MSIARLYAKINDPRRRPTPQVVVEAIMWAVRERGVAALHDVEEIERLSRCDQEARDQLGARISRLFPEEAA